MAVESNITNSRILSGWFPVLLCLFVLVCFASCSDKKEQEQKSKPYAANNFLDQVAKGNVEVVASLLSSGVDVNARDSDGDTALVIAAASRHTAMVKLLLEKGADFNARNNAGFTALMVASAMGKTDIVELLRKAGAKE